MLFVTIRGSRSTIPVPRVRVRVNISYRSYTTVEYRYETLTELTELSGAGNTPRTQRKVPYSAQPSTLAKSSTSGAQLQDDYKVLLAVAW